MRTIEFLINFILLVKVNSTFFIFVSKREMHALKFFVVFKAAIKQKSRKKKTSNLFSKRAGDCLVLKLKKIIYYYYRLFAFEAALTERLYIHEWLLRFRLAETRIINFLISIFEKKHFSNAQSLNVCLTHRYGGMGNVFKMERKNPTKQNYLCSPNLKSKAAAFVFLSFLKT